MSITDRRHVLLVFNIDSSPLHPPLVCLRNFGNVWGFEADAATCEIMVVLLLVCNATVLVFAIVQCAYLGCPACCLGRRLTFRSTCCQELLQELDVNIVTNGTWVKPKGHSFVEI